MNSPKLRIEPFNTEPNESSNQLLKVRTVNDCINEVKGKPEPKMLFSEFWHEGELCILFSDTNLGKSILAVQIANSISKGEPIHGFKLEGTKQRVLLIDFEMGDKQFEKRYSENYKNHYQFDDNFLRITINPDCSDMEHFEKKLKEELENHIEDTGAKILIIDNITYLKTQSTEQAKDALPLIKELKELKRRYDLSILCLAHTPKRNLANKITSNDLAGSKHFANFADSIFAIGESFKDKSLRYLKQTKARATEIIFDSNQVAICEINKPFNFLGFDFFRLESEHDHLKPISESQTTELDSNIIQMKKSEPNLSDAEIARRLDTYRTKVGRVLSKTRLK